MIVQVLPIRGDVETVVLEAYLLQDSPEFQRNAGRPAVIICPGGGYIVTSDREAEPVALRFLARGYHAFVLRYSVQTPFPQPMLDLARALLLVRAHADEWGLEPNQVAICGFSAGGHLAASLGVMWNEPGLSGPLGARPEQIRPDALILGYPVIDLDLVIDTAVASAPGEAPVRPRKRMMTTTLGEPDEALKERYRADRHVTDQTPPTFLWHTAEDTRVFPENALRFASALAGQKVPFELHIFERGEHGLSLADETSAVGPRFIEPRVQIWMDLALTWLERRWDTGSGA